MNVYGKSDIGLKRSSNQDCFDYQIVNDKMAWAVVCDGMGGANGGDVASNLAKQYVKDFMVRSCTADIKQEDIEDILKKAIYQANCEIFVESQRNSELSGMGTTVVLALVFEDKIHIAHVGDSRAYLIANNTVNQLTVDHSMVQKMVDDGEITHEQAKSHPNKNIITRALGVNKNVDIDYIMEDKLPGSSVLICTDGLTNHLEKNDILSYFQSENQKDVVDELISAANNCGGNDNITVVIICE